MPALATTTSMPPKRSTALAAVASIAGKSRTSATTVSTASSPPSWSANEASSALSRSVSTSLAPLLRSRWATSAPIPLAPPVMNTTLPCSDVMAETYLSQRLQFHPEQRIDRRCHQRRCPHVVSAVFQRIGGPTIKCNNRFGGVKVVGQVLAHPGDRVGGVRAGRQRGRGAPAMQPGACLVDNLLAPGPVRAIVSGQQPKPNGRWLHALGAQRRYQHQVAAALGHLVPVPADHPGVHIVPSESPFAPYT